MNQKSGCHVNETVDRIVLGNDLFEISLDRISGVIRQVVNKRTDTAWQEDAGAEVFCLEYCTYPNHGAVPGDAWSAVHGASIYSSRQQISNYTITDLPGGKSLQYSYDQLQLERRAIPVRLTVVVEWMDDSPETRWQMEIENHDPGTIRAVEFPIVTGLIPQEQLLMPNHGGEILHQPTELLSDELPLVYLEYPARASMQWFAYGGSREGLYFASYDAELSYTRLVFGRRSDQATAPGMWIVKYPFLVQDSVWHSPVYALGIHDGDWHWGADRYRAWAQSWMQPPQVPTHVREMIAGAVGITIRNSKEEQLHSYSDIPQIAAQNSRTNMDSFYMLVGWFYNGHDTFFPEYHANEEEGGGTALMEAIDQAHQHGAVIAAYMNARLCNNETETYRRYGKKWAVLTKSPGLGVHEIGFAELHENWNRTWDREKLSEGWFTVLCPAVKGRQDQLIGECVRAFQDYHLDGLFLDQPGSFWAELCYNPYHGHTNPATAWGPGYLQLFQRIHEETRRINPDSFLYTEGMNDAYGQYLDYHMDKNPLWAPMKTHPAAQTFSEMWRYTFPDYVTMNSPWIYSYPPSQDRIYGENYHFVMGIRFQFSLRVFKDWQQQASEEDRVAHCQVQEKIRHLWKKAGRWLFYDRFIDDVGLGGINPHCFAKIYQGSDHLAIPVWNTAPDIKEVELAVNLREAGISSATVRAYSVANDQDLTTHISDGVVYVKHSLPGNDIDVIVLQAE